MFDHLRRRRAPLRAAVAVAASAAAILAGATAPAQASLTLLKPDADVPATFYGKGGYSIDGMGKSGTGGTLQADVPAGSTVVQAYLHATYFDEHPPSEGQNIDFDGQQVTLFKIAQNNGYSGLGTARADVTQQVAAKIGAGGAMADFTVNSDPYGMDGLSLTVIYANANSPEVTIALLDGSAATSGDTTTFGFASPLNKDKPGFRATMAVGIGFSYQSFSLADPHQCGGGQVSTIDINGARLSSCAGGQDDGEPEDGALITVGGVGDSTANPAPNATNTGSDDELYDLVPFLENGDTQLTVDTYNPSANDNVFIAVVEVTARAGVGSGGELPPPPPPPADPAPLPLAPVATTPVAELTNATSLAPSFAAADDDAGTEGFECRLDGGEWAACESGTEFGGLADGPHTLEVRGVNADGVAGPVTTFEWVVDATKPAAPQAQAPEDSAERDIEIAFTGEEGGRFECSLDGGEFAECESPLQLEDLARGNHTVVIRQVDDAGNVGTVRELEWIVKAGLPAAPVVSGPAEGLTNAADVLATIAAADGDAEAVSFECRLDDGEWAPCEGTASFEDLPDGTHTLAVRAVNADGVAGPVTERSWTVDATAPEAPAAPADWSPDAPVVFVGEEGATFECSLDGGEWVPCASPFAVDGLAAGAHKLRVRQTDAAGNQGAEQVFEWTVAEPPVASTPVTAPAAKRECLSRRKSTIHWSVRKGTKLRQVTVKVNGELVRTLSGRARSTVIDLSGRPAGVYTVVIAGRTAKGAQLRTVRTYQTCRVGSRQQRKTIRLQAG